MNPYKVLGLTPGTEYKKEVIELAHKMARKKYHPDREGGSEELMTQANMARDILLNPERKKRFDETGSTESGQATMEEQIFMIIGNLFESAIAEETELTRAQLFALIYQKIIEGRDKARQAKYNHPRALARARKLLNSIECDAQLHRALSARIERIEREELTINQQVEIGDRMVALLKTIKFK